MYKPRDLWQIDLLDMQKFASQNSGFRYMCVVIDCFSKFLWVKPLKNKTAKSIVKALALLLMTERPKLLQADQGSEFFNKDVTRMLQAFGPKLYHTYSDKKASIVERVQRTLRSRLGRVYTEHGKNVWIDKIQDIVHSYNNSWHRSIKMKPANVTEEHIDRIRKLLNPTVIIEHNVKFNVGDLIRITSERKTFQKEYEKGWSEEKFLIKVVKYGSPTTFMLEDLSGEVLLGSFYAEELQHVS